MVASTLCRWWSNEGRRGPTNALGPCPRPTDCSCVRRPCTCTRGASDVVPASSDSPGLNTCHWSGGEGSAPDVAPSPAAEQHPERDHANAQEEVQPVIRNVDGDEVGRRGL